jgi:hypothetical protein
VIAYASIAAMANGYVRECYGADERSVSLRSFLADAEIGEDRASEAFAALADACLSQHPKCELCDNGGTVRMRCDYGVQRLAPCPECDGVVRERLAVDWDVPTVIRDTDHSTWLVVRDSVGLAIIGSGEKRFVAVRRQVRAGRTVVAAVKTLEAARAVLDDENGVCSVHARGRGRSVCEACAEARLGSSLAGSVGRVA